MRTETTVSLGWIARRLDLRSASNVCHQIRGSQASKSGLTRSFGAMEHSIESDCPTHCRWIIASPSLPTRYLWVLIP
jgi:hypothetical protein